jgi:type I restriction-modification system DNA methylase subunit
METQQLLSQLVARFNTAEQEGSLQNSSEETIRTWINELLSIFGWDVQNTHHVLQERTLGREERSRLKTIGSTNIRPDYTLVNGKIMLAFVDAKSLEVNIENDSDAAFQIKSYGWSIGAKFSIVTNFKELAIYDCTAMPCVNDNAAYARLHYLKSDEYVDNFETLNHFLSRNNVINGNISFLTRTGESLDQRFSKLLARTRIELADSILRNNTIDSLDAISSYVQIIINRILFIRVCESRGLETDGLLQEFVNTGFWQSFKQSSYLDFYEHYDGPMFKRIRAMHNLVIDNEVFINFLHNLYYPSPYRFDVIPLKTLSDIYDLFLGYKLVSNNGIISDELKSEFKKSNGAVTTPEHIVRKVIECTMPAKHFEEMTIDDILKLKIVDIACGSGVFLVGVYDFLARIITEKLANGEQSTKEIALCTPSPILTIEGRKQIINNCLFGVDINPEAVEVAKMSLSLKIIDDYEPIDYENVGLLGAQILKGIGANIKCGNSLVSTDIEDVCPTISDFLLELKATNAFNWEEQFEAIFKNGGFDYVIGNPPYVEVKNYNVELPHMATYVKRMYSSSKNGKVDLAIPFIEKGLSILNNSGRLGYIIQKRFFKTDYGKGIRKLLSSQKVVSGIYDYSETNLFENRITYVAILTCDKSTDKNEFVSYQNSQSSEVHLIKSASLSDTPWIFDNLQLNALRQNLAERLGTLKDICNVKVGLQVLWNDAYQIHVRSTDENYIYGYTAIDDNVIVEKSACRPLLCNEKFAPLTKREYSTYAIFPYHVSEQGVVTELSMSDYALEYPKAAAYLKRHEGVIKDNVETLPDISPSVYNSKEHWHLYTRANNHGATYEKICVPMTAQYPQAAVIMDRNIYCDNANMFFIQVPSATETETKTKLYALSALINSTIFAAFARSIANPQQGGYYKFNKQFLSPVPVPQKAFEQCSDDIIRLADIAKRIESANRLMSASGHNSANGLVNSIQRLWDELDSTCDTLYGISDADRELLYSTERKDRINYE